MIKIKLLRWGTAFLIALIIWITTYKYAYHTKVLTFPIEVRHNSKIFIYNNLDNIELKLTLQGSEEVFQGLKKIPIVVNLPDLRTPIEGKKVLILKENITLPEQLTLIDYSPKKISLDIDIIRRKTVSINVIDELTNPNDKTQTIQRMSFLPKKIAIIGPSKIVDNIYDISTTYISYDKIIKNNGAVTGELYPLYNRLKLEQNTVNILYDIALPSKTITLAKKLKLTVSQDIILPTNKILPIVKASIKGPKEIIDKLKQEDYEFFIDYQEENTLLDIKFWSKYKALKILFMSPKKYSIR